MPHKFTCHKVYHFSWRSVCSPGSITMFRPRYNQFGRVGIIFSVTVRLKQRKLNQISTNNLFVVVYKETILDIMFTYSFTCNV